MIPGITTVLNSPVKDMIVLIDIPLHMLVGYLLVGFLTNRDPKWGAIGGLLPNIDLLFDIWPRNAPLLVHRGLLHTPFFLLLVVTGIYIVGKVKGFNVRKVVGPLAIGYLAELLLDLFEGHEGVMLAYPVQTLHYSIPVPHMDFWVPLLFVEALILAMYYRYGGRVKAFKI